MKLLLKRIALKPTYTIGWLYIDGKRSATPSKMPCET